MSDTMSWFHMGKILCLLNLRHLTSSFTSIIITTVNKGSTAHPYWTLEGYVNAHSLPHRAMTMLPYLTSWE